ncbi:YsnF/AvaK domain-containing protein [Paracoccus sp. (in: a-proteobacteria)]|uniref:YsnF/AvaK domain-containing protein n=1 Tax=Paracoccus sp. TaxID=267 RepID=UPI0026DFC57B|nr:YsnF/AvaK domain-containing protein [Paracoccus sp. (in: a-proteobacteria)]MDO5371061.1 YsnF/AvaK domain-containing protein [Paracoccus sp. (in: a-proteobacteria)]
MTSRQDRDENIPDPANLREREAMAKGRLASDDVLTVVEEQARISVKRHETGGVRVRVVTEEAPEIHPVALEAERVEVTRQPVGREIENFPDIREDGDVTIIPVVEERAVVVTRLFLVEEIHIRRTRSTETVDVPVTLRRQRAVVEPLDPEAAASGPVTGQGGLPDHDL